MHLLFSNRRLLFLAIILIVSNIVISGISTFVIYTKSIANFESFLIDAAERQRSLVTTLREQGKSEQEILEFIKLMRSKHYSIGQTGEFDIVRRSGNSVEFLLSENEPVPYRMINAKSHRIAAQLALDGKQGFVNDSKITGKSAMEAYTYVPSLHWGIIARIPKDEVNKSYLNAFVLATLVLTILLILSIYLFVRISNPFLKSIINSEDKFRRAVELAPFPIMIHARGGEVLNVSQGWIDITGYNLSDIPAIEKWIKLAYGETQLNLREYIDTLYDKKTSGHDGEYLINCKNNEKRIWDFSSAPLGRLNDGRHAVISVAKDVTEQKQIENERESILQLLNLFNQSSDLHSLMKAVTEFLQNLTKCEAVGIRLREGDDFPYFETNGFPENFVLKEKFLCAYDLTGQIIRDKCDDAVLECMCGNVICSRFDPSKPFFTAKGSFWTNCTTELLASTTEADRQSGTRNRCNGAGYESVALIPLRNGNETFGLIQLNDKRPGMFTRGTIDFVERLSDNISLAMHEQITQKHLIESEERFKMLFDKAPVGYQTLNMDGCLTEVNETWLNMLGYSKEEVLGKWFGDFLAPDYVNAFWEGLKLFKSRGNIHLEFEMIRKKGSQIFIAFDGRISHAENGKFNQMHCALNDVTNSRLAENKLKENNSRLELAMKVADMAWWEIDLATGSVIFEKRKAEMLGYDPGKFKHYTDFMALVHPEDYENTMIAMRDHMSGLLGRYETEYRIRCSNGEYKWFYDIGTIVKRDAKGKPLKITGLVINISNRKQAEEGLLNYSQRLGLAITSGQMGIWDWNVKDNIMIWDDKMYELYGVSPDNSKNNIDIWTNGLHPEDKQRAIDECNAALTGEGEFNTNFRVLHPDGKVLFIKADSIVLRDNQGKPLRMIGINRDITETINAENELRRNEILIRNAVENLPIIFYLIDGDGIFKLSIGAGLKGLGLKPNEVVDLSVFEIYKNYPDITDAIHKALLGENASFESNINGVSFYNVLTPFVNLSGELKSVAGVALDITERKQAEREIIIAKERAEESDRLKTAFVQNMSHEIRTPMNAIMGFSELLVRNFNNKPKLEHFSGIINQRCTDLLNIINDLLDIARIESGQLPVFVEKCNLTQLFAEIKTFFTEQQPVLKKQNILFDMIDHYDLQGVFIFTDKVKLRQIFINLITNAFKFTQKGKIEGGCIISESRKLTFYVSDTGIGIPEDKFQFVFERFSQVEKGNARFYGGTGLGLSIVKGLVEILGGQIWLESELGKGTTFFFTLSGEEQPETLVVPLQEDYTLNTVQAGKTILIVEDDMYNMVLIEEMISELGFNVLQARTGMEAVEVALSRVPEIILMDIGLPDMSGYEAIGKILGEQPSMKIIAQTAYAAPKDRVKAIASGCIDYISKPVKSKDLLSMVSKYLL